jgi:hypothetical protein
VRHFDRLVTRSLGLDRHPELAATYFGNYRRIVYLAQAPTAQSLARAGAIAEAMGLAFEFRFTGYGGLGAGLERVVARQEAVAWPI